MNDATISADTREFHRALAGLLRIYQFRDRERICCHDVSVTQCNALEALADEALALNELATALLLSKSTTSRVVDTLEAKGYAIRRPHPASGRSVLVEATPAGRALQRRIENEILAEEQRLLADFSPETRARMTRLLDALADAASRRTPKPTCK